MLYHWIATCLTVKYHDHANVSSLTLLSHWCLMRFLWRKIWILKPIIWTHIQLLPNFHLGISTELQLIRIYSRFSSAVPESLLLKSSQCLTSSLHRLCEGCAVLLVHSHWLWMCFCFKRHFCGVWSKWPWAKNIRLCLVFLFFVFSQFNWKIVNKAPSGCELWDTSTNKTLARSQHWQEWVQGSEKKDDEVNHSRYRDFRQNALHHFSSPISQSWSPQCAALEWQSHILTHVHGPQVLIQSTDVTLRQPLRSGSQ